MHTYSVKVKAEVNIGEILTGHTCAVVTDRQLLVGKALSFGSSVVMLGRYRYQKSQNVPICFTSKREQLQEI